MWERLEVSSRELKRFPTGLRISLGGLNFFKWNGLRLFLGGGGLFSVVETFSRRDYFLENCDLFLWGWGRKAGKISGKLYSKTH